MENIFISSWKHCDIFGKIDIVVLCLLSIYSWYVIIEKFFIIRNAYKKNKIFESYLVSKKEIKKIPSPIYSIFHYVQSLLKYEKMDFETAKKYIEKGFIKEQINLERNLTSLATISAVAPFLGLLGTVWGLLIAFTNMSITGSSSIRVVAGGVAEALITTVIGLLVAIPAAVGYNYFKDKVQNLMEEMEVLIPFIEEYISMQFFKDEEIKRNKNGL
ncbi:MAG: MotA/TolQ/ExbB proton channel family protein [Candidatus Omnitrophica bacterium]|nr:MotA/TolQ/ExbB proton channel family protein [Candidatus Omnitrophota bacterium]